MIPVRNTSDTDTVILMVLWYFSVPIYILNTIKLCDIKSI